jgi:glycosyltransferase involved in cell wall biosynthesis
MEKATEVNTPFKRVSIVQDTVPGYRVPFFETLLSLGKRDGIQYQIFVSARNQGQNQNSLGFNTLPSLEFKIFRKLYLHYDFTKLDDSDAVVIEQALHNPFLLGNLLRSKVHSPKILFWGHGGYWTKKVSRLQSNLMWFILKKSDHFLVYTEEGAIRLIENNYPLAKITVLRNSIDTLEIATEISRISEKENIAWLKDLGLDFGNFGCFIGEFKDEKNLDFLISAVIEIHRQIPSFKFAFFGMGSGAKPVLDACKKYPWIKYGGQAGATEKAHLSKANAIILNPGRVGLIAVDSIAMQAPMVTRNLEMVHAPEIEYLSHPSSLIISEASHKTFVDSVVALLHDAETRKNMSQNLHLLQPSYSIEIMAKNFHRAILGIL